MNDSVLKKYMVPKPAAEPTAAPEAEGLDDLGAFGFLRGVRDRAIMLELRHRDGKISAFGYAWLDSVQFDPSEGITLHFGGRQVKLIGRNLNSEARPNMRLLAGIVRHRVPWIQEADGASALEAKKDATVIEGIEVT
jgi:hypothetical protein